MTCTLCIIYPLVYFNGQLFIDFHFCYRPFISLFQRSTFYCFLFLLSCHLSVYGPLLIVTLWDFNIPWRSQAVPDEILDFLHDFTKIKTTKLFILLRFYFHDAKQQVKTNIHTNFRSEWVLGFVIDHGIYTTAERAIVFVKKVTYFREFGYLNSLFIRKRIILLRLSITCGF